jgi:hypothetical protein
MRWKRFLKSTIAKSILLIIFMLRLNTLTSQGFPFPIYATGCKFFGEGCINRFVWIDLILDIIFWYVISCIIVFVYEWLKKHR